MIPSQSIQAYQGSISKDLASLNPVLQRVYAARHISSLKELDYHLRNLLHFKGLKNIKAAAKLLGHAIEHNKKIVIIGDFDADGATSTALVVKALQQFGAKQVDYLIPNRFQYGYGLSPEIVSVAKQPDLIMTVDNGISSDQGVRAAKEMGIQVLITDHHLAPDILPPADVIVNPQQPGDTFSSKHLAGVGVAFYVMLALRDYLKETGWFTDQRIMYPKMDYLLDLVALGTIADMVPLDLNNRILVYHGLQKIRSGKACDGINALFELSGCELQHGTAGHLGFSIAPRLNAAGRIQDMSLGVDCLLTQDRNLASTLAKQLDALNKERRSIEDTMQKKAIYHLRDLHVPLSKTSVCLFDDNWHEGIIGLVAGRIKDRLHKPTIIFAPSQKADILKGSARSIPGIHIRDLLAEIAQQHPHLIATFGGHAAAAGLSLAKTHYQSFTEIFEQKTKKAMLTLSHSIQQTDGVLGPDQLTVELASLIRLGGPWGQGFPEPLFEGQFEIVSQRIVGQKHLQMTLAYPNVTRPFKAILFNTDLDKWPNLRVSSVKVLYRLMLDRWEGRKELKIQIEKLYH